MTFEHDVVMMTGRFMKAGGQRVPDQPSLPTEAQVERRISLIDEEFTEYKDAVAAGDAAGILDAAIDMAVVAVGAGLDMAPIEVVREAMRRVLEANAAKIMPDGTLHTRADGKILKPEGWVGPDIASLLK